MKTIQEWLNGALMRRIELTPHCHGIRLTVHDDHHEVCSVVESTLERAWESAQVNIPVAMHRLKLRRKQYLEARINDLRTEILNAEDLLEREFPSKGRKKNG